MSEYFFDYTCKARGEKHLKSSDNNKDLKFLIYQDYESTLCDYCVLVPINLPEQFEGIKVCHISNGIDIPMGFDQISEVGGNSSTGIEYFSRNIINKYGGFIIRAKYYTDESEILTGTGVFGFVKKKEELPELEDTFIYSINFCLKQEIYYTITESKRKLTIDILHPLLRNDIEIIVNAKLGSKPLMKDDLHENDIKSIKLRAGISNYLHLTRTVVGTEKNDFRLFFKNSADSQYYLLVDESKETFEERKEKQGKRNQRGNRYYNDHKKEPYKCPFCFEKLAFKPHKKEKKGYLFNCNESTPIKIPLITGIGSDEQIICCGNPYGKNMKREHSLYRHQIIPNEFFQKKHFNCTVIGYTNSGKSILLSALLGARSYEQEQLQSGETSSTRLTSYLLNSVVKKYDKSRKDTQPYVMKNLKLSAESSIVSRVTDTEEYFFKKINRETIRGITKDLTSGMKATKELVLKNYTISVGKNISQHTEVLDMEILNMHPFGFELGNLGYGFFYDVPGEVLTLDNPNLEALRTVKGADCLIAIIDGYNNEYIESSVAILCDVLDSVNERLLNKKLNEIPVAIVLSKFDQHVHLFDDNCHVVREDMLKMINEKKLKYEGSDIERHIDCSSYEIEHYLLSQSAQSCKNLITLLKSNFKYYKFFAVSALGSGDCFVETDERYHDGSRKKKLIYHERPLRVELPLIWLMYQRGLIRR